MKVITANPIVINNKRISPTSMYLSFSGTTPGEIKSFQAWYNSKGYTPKLAVDGVNGPMTSAAIAKYGSQFDASFTSVPKAPDISSSGIPPYMSVPPTSGAKTTAAQRAEKAKAIAGTVKESGLIDSFLNKIGANKGQSAPEVTIDLPPEGKKPMSTGAKIGIGVGVAALLGGIIYYAVKKRK